MRVLGDRDFQTNFASQERFSAAALREPVLDALHDAPEIAVVSTRHEGAAANMAEADGKLTGRPGICLVTRAHRNVLIADDPPATGAERPTA